MYGVPYSNSAQIYTVQYIPAVLKRKYICFQLFPSEGLWTSSFQLGNFVGPTVSGFMVDAWGFR